MADKAVVFRDTRKKIVESRRDVAEKFRFAAMSRMHVVIFIAPRTPDVQLIILFVGYPESFLILILAVGLRLSIFGSKLELVLSFEPCQRNRAQ